MLSLLLRAMTFLVTLIVPGLIVVFSAEVLTETFNLVWVRVGVRVRVTLPIYVAIVALSLMLILHFHLFCRESEK